MWTSNRSCRSHWTERERRPHELTHVTRPGRNIVSGIHDACFTGDGPSNVIYILADDAGINEFGVSVGQLIDTPNIDRMAQEAIEFIRQNRTQPFFCAWPIGMCTNPMWQSRPW